MSIELMSGIMIFVLVVLPLILSVLPIERMLAPKVRVMSDEEIEAILSEVK